MRAVIVPLLCCPVSRQGLRLWVEKGELAPLPEGIALEAYSEAELRRVVEESNLEEPPAAAAGEASLAERLMGYEVMEGALYTADRRHVYPIVAGIPRLLPPDVAQHPAAIEHYRRRLDAEAPSTREMSGEWKKILEHNIESYTIQWSEFEYDETTWGFTLDDRFEMIQDELGIRGELSAWSGKRHVDAACGNGTLAIRTAEIGLEVFAFDQSHSIERAFAFSRDRRLPHSGIVHFIQGNLVAPPLQPGRFDMLYSGGAIHMTPDFEHTLGELARLLRPRASRMYVWTGRRRVIVGLLYDTIRIVLSAFPVPARRVVARIGVIPYMGIQWVLRAIYGARAFPRLSFNENLVRFLDAASHRFGQVPSAAVFEDMVARLEFDSQETKRPGHRGYGILAVRR